MATYQYTQASARAEVRVRIDEPVASNFSDATIDGWINEGALIVARTALCLPNEEQITVTANVATALLPLDTLTVSTMEFIPTGANWVFTLKQIAPYSFKHNLGVWRQYPTWAPQYWSCFQVVPGGQFTIWPTPNQSGIINCYYYRLPAPMVADTDNLDLPVGWQDLALDWAEKRCTLTNRDPSYSMMVQEFERKVQSMVQVATPSLETSTIDNMYSAGFMGDF